MTETSAARPARRTATTSTRPITATGSNHRRNHATRPPRGAGPVPVRARGVYRPHPRGFGFVDLNAPIAVPGKEPVTSCFVPPPLAAGLLDGDTVEVAVDIADGRGTATRATVTTRSRTHVFGVVENGEKGKVLRVDPHVGHGRWALRGPVPVAGAAVLAEVVGTDATGKVTRMWPSATSAEALRERVLARHAITVDYPTAVLEQVAGIVAGTHARICPQRTDLTGQTTVTIDAPSSRDLDDALAVTAGPDGTLRVFVSIADVAAHLEPGSPLDVEAARTGTSVYLPRWNRPMLPPQLSEDALSLLPGVERDTLTVELLVGRDGVVAGDQAKVYASTIRSTCRISYEDAAAIMAGAKPAQGYPAAVTDTVRLLADAAERLGAQRERRGGIGGGRTEPAVVVDIVDGRAAAVPAAPQNAAHLMVERLMVAANEAVAQWLLARELPGMYRTHPAPDADVTARLAAFCASHGISVDLGATLTPQTAALLEVALAAAPAAAQAGLWDVLMAGMGRAEYTPHPGQHFGLGSEAYLHFTSPIRRYADVLVHRAVHAHLAGLPAAALPGVEELTAVGTALNDGAGVAARAEAHARKSMWMDVLARQQKTAPGAVLTGRVSGVNAKGVFVTLDGSLVTGMLSARTLPGRDWVLDEHGFALVHEDGSRYAIGEPVSVKVLSACAESGQLELVLPAYQPPRREPRGGRTGGAPRADGGSGRGRGRRSQPRNRLAAS